MNEVTLVSTDQNDMPTRTGGYGRCASCGNLKALDQFGHPHPHNRFDYRSSRFEVRRCEGERFPARRQTADAA
ncbi:hypothetical protein [Pseudonocardia pini]|uniref:hypothetical protein n=1 Tax=Pseudonocardia pini TaxID=2758030 RepID=UPI0015F04869|nr:hypothetical protein [Pseudonocardia pini]